MAVGRQNFLGSGYRAATFVPLIRGETAIGALSVVRVSIGPLSEKQLAALKTYASQAVIAIENARLLSELHQRTADLTELLEQQTATSRRAERHFRGRRAIWNRCSMHCWKMQRGSAARNSAPLFLAEGDGLPQRRSAWRAARVYRSAAPRALCQAGFRYRYRSSCGDQTHRSRSPTSGPSLLIQVTRIGLPSSSSRAREP